jgi:uncharacterized protein YraI
MGLVAAVIVLGAVVLLIFLLLSRLFSSPSGSGGATATPDPVLTATVTATLTVTPGAPTAIALSNVSVRSGPDTVFEVIGVLPAGSSTAITGRTESGDWWQVQGPNIQGGQGWAPADQVEARNAASAPVVASPPTPTPTPTPLTTFRGWKGEYFANPNLQPPPTVVQDDPTINFNWGAGAPAPGVPPNNFSVRWSRQAFFEEGNYRIQVNVEGGVRLSLDGRPLIDDWQNSSLRVLEVDSGVLARGTGGAGGVRHAVRCATRPAWRRQPWPWGCSQARRLRARCEYRVGIPRRTTPPAEYRENGCETA